MTLAIVCALANQKAQMIVKVLIEGVIPFFGVPESLLSDRGTNLLSHLMKEICSMLGIIKLNTTAYHPQFDGMVERFNQTLKSTLHKHASRFGNQWDTNLSSILLAYRTHSMKAQVRNLHLYGLG